MGDETYIPVDSILLPADLIVPYRATGLVVFVHGSGSSRLSPRNRSVAEILRASGQGTLLFDLLTRDEEAEDRITAEFRFDIGFLAERLLAATHWARRQVPDLSIGYFGASTGAAAALAAATQAQHSIGAIVSRGGRPDLAGRHLPQVRAPTLLIVGGLDGAVIDMNRAAYESLACEKDLRVIPGASHLFEEPGTLDQVARFAADWFQQHLVAVSGERAGLGSTRPSHPHPRH